MTEPGGKNCDVIIAIKWRVRWLGYVARMRENRTARRKAEKIGGTELLIRRRCMPEDAFKTKSLRNGFEGLDFVSTKTAI
jgi:hypothetical protein